MLDLLFSPSGSVGRAVYWISQILSLLAILLLFLVAFVIIGAACNKLDPSLASHVVSHQNLRPADEAHLVAAVQSMEGELFAIGALILALYWSTIAIEIKRWHDRGLSGFLVLLRFIWPGFQAYRHWHPVSGGTVLVVAISMFVVGVIVLIQLGFLAGVYTAPPRQSSQRYPTGQFNRPGG